MAWLCLGAQFGELGWLPGFSTQCPLLLHWDGKLLTDIGGMKETVDRIAVIVTGNGVEKLLAVPKIGKETGQEQAAACIKTLNDWGISEKNSGSCLRHDSIKQGHPQRSMCTY